MSEILVSNTIYTDLAVRWQWIDYNPDAMAQMANALDTPPPDSDWPIYVIHDGDIKTEFVWHGQYASQKLLPMTVYHQGPAKKRKWVLPDHTVFALRLKNTGFDNSALTDATANRLLLPRRRRREGIARVFGGALAVGGMGLIYATPYDEVGLATAVSGFILAAWGGPKPRVPDLSNMTPPLFLENCPPVQSSFGG